MKRTRRASRSGRSPFVVGAVVLAVMAACTYLGFTKDIPFVGGGYEVSAAFRDSSGIKTGSPVRIAGVEVGKVVKVTSEGSGLRAATVRMRIKEGGLPLHRDARFKIRPRIFLEGNFFVDIRPGTPRAGRLEDGSTVPVSQTANPVQLDEVLAVLTSDTRKDLRRLLQGLSSAQEAGAGRAFNRSLRFQPQAFRYSAEAAEALLGERPGDLRRALGSTATVAGALDAAPERLMSFIEDFNTTAGALASEEQALRAAITELPRTLAVGSDAMGALNDAFPDLRRFAVSAVPAVRSTGPTARALTPLTRELRGLVGEDELRGLLAGLRQATPPLARTARTIVPTLRQTRELMSCFSEVLVPFGNDTVDDPDFKATGPVHEETAKFLPGLAGESRSFDANGQWFKVLGSGGPETFTLGNGLIGTGPTSVAGVNPPYDRTRPPIRPEVPCETQERPNLSSRPQGAPTSTRQDGPAVQRRRELAREAAREILAPTKKAAGR